MVAVAVAVETTVTVTVAVGLAVEPVGFDGFFSCIRAIWGRIMRMGMARITRMGALCVRYGVLGRSRKKRAETGGCFRGVNDGDKIGRQWKTI